jgi:phage terminase large subunit-like protein
MFAPASSISSFRNLSETAQLERFYSLNEDEMNALLYEWHFWARPNQQTPPLPWTYWLILAGRGFGKTRTGAEWVREEIKTNRYVNLIGATADDARDIMIEGESGILECCPDNERPRYVPSKRRLEWPNGARSLIFTADEPERLRGKQHGKLWADEVAAWRYPESWAQAKFGLRLGQNPQACLTTTPKPIKILRDLIKDPATHVTRGSTYDNKANLAPTFLSAIVKAYEGTRLGRQELNAEMLEDNPNALWKYAQFDDGRVLVAPALTRIVVAVDPAVTSNENSDETGIVVAGKSEDDQFYILCDATLTASPNAWARAAVDAFRKYNCDRLVAEVNNGGDMVEAVIRGVDANVSYKKVTATRGKTRRAEPIAALYEQGRVHHVGAFPLMETQMAEYNPLEPDANGSPDRMDALVWALTELSGATNTGLIDFYTQQANQ